MKKACSDKSPQLAFFNEKVLHGTIINQYLRIDLKDVLVLFGNALETAKNVKCHHYC